MESNAETKRSDKTRHHVVHTNLGDGYESAGACSDRAKKKRGTVSYAQLEHKRLLQSGLADCMTLGVTGLERAGGWGLITPVLVQAAACI